MNLLRTCLMLALVLLPSSMARAQDWVYYGISVCNKGQMHFDVASAEKKPGEWALSNYSWHIEGWTPIAPKQCESVWADKNWESGFTVTKPIVHLVFAFKDSTGVWGANKLEVGKTRWRKSDLQFCVRQPPFGYDRPKGDPSTGCKSGYFLMPASVDFDPAPTVGANVWGAPVVTSIDVELTAEDRAIRPGGEADRSSGTSKGSSDSSNVTAGEIAGALAAAARIGAAIAHYADQPPQPLPAPAPSPAPAVVKGPAELVDDPLGPGGYITPPAKFPVLVCVQQNLVDKQSWGDPAAGSKMAAFRSMAARYIGSIAKPGWEYWIAEAQFARFDPAAAAGGENFVSKVSPDSEKFDVFNPQCPSGYAGYNLQVSR